MKSAKLALLLGVVWMIATIPQPSFAGGIVTESTPLAGTSHDDSYSSTKALNRCQRELPYSLSRLKPKVRYLPESNEALVWGRVRLWDDDMDGCRIRSCTQERKTKTTWHVANWCWNYTLKYEGQPSNYESWRVTFDCDRLNRIQDDVRSFVRLIRGDGQVGGGYFGRARDACPNDGG